MTLVRGSEDAARIRSLADLGTSAIGAATLAIAGLAAVSTARTGEGQVTLRLLDALQVAQVLLALALALTIGARALLGGVREVRIATAVLSGATVLFGLTALAARTLDPAGAGGPLSATGVSCTSALLLTAVLAGGVLIGRTQR